VIRIPCRRRFDLAAVKKIREIIGTQGIELVHSHGYKSDIYAYLAARRTGVPLLATSHLWTRQTAAIRFYEFLDARALRSFDAVVAVSDRIAAELGEAGVPAGQIKLIDNGIDLSPFNSAVPVLKSELTTADQLLIGTVGRLVAQKGLTFFLMAAQQLLKEFPNLKFAIVGDGPDRGKLQQMAKDLGIENHVCFTGARSDMPNVYASLDVFALASVSEGLPMALLEAMASGVPVVATEVGAVPKVILPGKTGMLVRPGDAAELAQAIACLLRDPALRERLAEIGKQEIRGQFSSQVMTQNYCRVYEEIGYRLQVTGDR
jgi:glycosyltransferase involved in cell wall biosynthesis